MYTIHVQQSLKYDLTKPEIYRLQDSMKSNFLFQKSIMLNTGDFMMLILPSSLLHWKQKLMYAEYYILYNFLIQDKLKHLSYK